jgi:hypothetical protein
MASLVRGAGCYRGDDKLVLCKFQIFEDERPSSVIGINNGYLSCQGNRILPLVSSLLASTAMDH